MKLSIIIPAYNAEKYLEECLHSVFKEVDMPYECIVVNDGSCDGTEDILKDFSTHEKRLKYRSTLNQGVSAARNLGISIAQGEYILFLDSDDYLTEDAISKINDIISSKEDLYVFNYYENRGKKPKKAIPVRNDIKTCAEMIEYYAIKNNYLNSACGKLLKRDIITSHHISFPINMKFAEDACFMLNYLKYVRSIRVFDCVIFYYRMHETNSINNVSKQRLTDYCVEMNERISLCHEMKMSISLNELYRTYMYMLFYFCISYVACFSIKGAKIFFNDVKKSEFYHQIMGNIDISYFKGTTKIVFVILNKLNWAMFYIAFTLLNFVKRIKHSIV